MRKHFARFIISVAVLAGGYFLLNRENASSYTIPFVELRRKAVSENIGKTAGNLKNYLSGQATATVLELADDLAATFLEKSEQTVSLAIDGAKTETFRFFSKAVNEKVNTVGENLGVDVQKIGKEIAPPERESPIIFGIQAGIPAYFSIKNRESEKISYEVDWLDGNKKSGEVAVGKSATVSHQWNSSGEYHPKFKIITSRGEKIYEVAISVISL